MKKKILSLLLVICMAPLFIMLVGCKETKPDIPYEPNTPNVEDTTLYTTCVTSLKTAINNLFNNTNDLLDGFSIRQFNYYGFRGEVSEIYFESEKFDDTFFGNVYFSSYNYLYNGQQEKHYSRYDADLKIIDTYVKESDGTYTKRTDMPDLGILTDQLKVPTGHAFIKDFEENDIISYYAIDNNTYEINTKVELNDSETIIIKYTVCSDELVDIETNYYNSHGIITDMSYMYIIEYSKSVDAYEEYMNAYNTNK